MDDHNKSNNDCNYQTRNTLILCHNMAAFFKSTKYCRMCSLSGRTPEPSRKLCLIWTQFPSSCWCLLLYFKKTTTLHLQAGTPSWGDRQGSSMGKSIWRPSGLHLKDQVGTRPRLPFSLDSWRHVIHTCLGHHNRVRLCGQIHYVDNLACPDLSFFICKMGLIPF